VANSLTPTLKTSSSHYH